MRGQSWWRLLCEAGGTEGESDEDSDEDSGRSPDEPAGGPAQGGTRAGYAATASLGPTGWALLLALPLLAIALAALTARQTLLAALKKIL